MSFAYVFYYGSVVPKRDQYNLQFSLSLSNIFVLQTWCEVWNIAKIDHLIDLGGGPGDLCPLEVALLQQLFYVLLFLLQCFL